MAQKYLVSIDLNKNELQNARIQNLGTAPSAPGPGQVYYDTTFNTSFEWNGTAWIARDATKVANGTIPLAKLTTDPLARANHTGTQVVGTITGLAAVATSGSKADVGLGNVDNTSDATERAAVATLTNKTINLASNTLVATSSQIAAALSDETGTGSLVFGTSPSLVTPIINGTPSGSGVATLNSASTLVLRDASGNFSASTITAALTGTASGNLVSGGALGTPSSGVATNLTGTATGLTSGITEALKSATTTVSVSAAAAPTTGQYLVATSSTSATWQTMAAGGVTAVSGTAPIVSSGGATPAISISAATTSTPGSLSAVDKTKLDGVATGATANSSDAILLARVNHTGTQLASTISNFDTQVRTNSLSQMAAPIASVAMNSQKLTGLANGSVASDSAAFGQIQAAVDSALVGLKWKDPVRVASTANVIVASALINASVIDGVTLATGDRVLLKDQTTGSENGIYIVAATGAASRSLDTNTSAVIKDMSVLVAQGTLSEGFQFKLQTDNVTLGSTALVFVQHGQGATVLTAGNGLTATANAFNVGAGTGITVAADTVSIDSAVVVRKYATTFGDGTSTSIAITHSLNNQDAIAVVRQVSDNAVIICDVIYTSANVITLGFVTAPAASALRISVMA